MKKWLLRGAIAVAVLAVAGLIFLRSIGMFSSQPVYASGGAAINGYDPVAYFTDSKPVKGDKAFSETWNGATWLFASEEHKAMFRAMPERYAPQFGGYCAFAVSHNYTAKTDPNAWTVVNDKLYLNFDQDTQKEWLAQRDPFIKQGEANWPKVLW